MEAVEIYPLLKTPNSILRTNKIMSRRQARELSLQMLFMHSFNKCSDDNVKKNIFYFAKTRKLMLKSSIGFTKKIVFGTLGNIKSIDEVINSILKNWKLNRLSVVDLNILRLAIFEIKWCSDIPFKVSVNEANELAKKYSSKDSNKFVNGLLDSVIKNRSLIIDS